MRNTHRDGYTGHLYEAEVLGVCQARYSGYMKWHDAAAWVRENQPVQKTPMAVTLQTEVTRHIGEAVDFFTAVRSALDRFHGVDGFFVYRGFVVTIDVTMNPHKDAGKADVIVHMDDFADLSALAGRIAREFTTKQRRAFR